MTTQIGKTLTVYCFSCRGRRNVAGLKRGLIEIVRYAKMRPVIDKPLAWGYPLDGKGGYGETIFLPFGEGEIMLSKWKKMILRFLIKRFKWAFLLFQPFTDSFAVLDTYPDNKKDDGRPDPKIALVFATCLPIEDEYGLRLKVAKNFGTITKFAKVDL